MQGFSYDLLIVKPPDKREQLKNISFISQPKHAECTQKNRLNELVLLSTPKAHVYTDRLRNKHSFMQRKLAYLDL